MTSNGQAVVLLYMMCLICVSYTVNPACECVVFSSDGRSQGTFTSPNYPKIYPTNINCILYTFMGELDEIVEITFFEFDLQVPTTNKCTDFLRFFLDLPRPEVNERDIHNYEICGNITMIQKTHYSSTRALILEFHSDQVQGNNTGFRGIFKFLEKARFEIEGGNKRWGTQCTYDFYSNRVTKSGKFFSPSYPQNYPPEANCQYVFSGTKNERVKVTFQNIQMERIDGSCTDSPDFIVVRDGLDATSPVIAQYCNTLNGVEVISSGENLYVEFIVDDKKQAQGFAATFEFVPENQLAPQKPNVLPSEYRDFGVNTHNPGDDPGYVVPTPSTTREITTDCQYEFLSSHRKNGTFTSPHYPNPYPESKRCHYIFQGQGKERVQIAFNDLDLNYDALSNSGQSCEDADSVIVSIKIEGQTKDIARYCGSEKPLMLMSNNNRLDVYFVTRSREPTSSRGFKATYRFVTDYGIKTGVQDENTACGFIYRSSDAKSGTFTSPNFPGIYPRDTECHYIFYGDEEKIYITFPFFDVEGLPPNCDETTDSDYIEFSNFEFRDRKMARYCGMRLGKEKKEVHSDGPFFRVIFKSNDKFDGQGFEAFYQFRRIKELSSALPKPAVTKLAMSGQTSCCAVVPSGWVCAGLLIALLLS